MRVSATGKGYRPVLNEAAGRSIRGLPVLVHEACIPFIPAHFIGDHALIEPQAIPFTHPSTTLVVASLRLLPAIGSRMPPEKAFSRKRQLKNGGTRRARVIY